MSEYKPEYLIAARDMLNNAKLNLCHAISALTMTGANFDKTNDEIKKTIGDIEYAIHLLDDQNNVTRDES